MRKLIFLLFTLYSVLAFAESPSGALMDWSGQDPVYETECRLQVFDISLAENGEVQFLSQLKFENPFFVSPRIWLVQQGEGADLHSGYSSENRFFMQLYTTGPGAPLPSIETVKIQSMDDESLPSRKCSAYDESFLRD